MQRDNNPDLQRRVQRLQAKYEREIPDDDDMSFLRTIDGLLGPVSASLYADSFHFILELIQNAVDSARSEPNGDQRVSVRFQLTTDPPQLVASNDGAPFTETDILRLCGQPKTRKGPRKIGYKGIGFKSVVCITDNPQIYSPGCQFEFSRHHYPDYPFAWLIIPRWIDAPPASVNLPEGWVSVVLPLKETMTGKGMDSLAREMDELPPELLLFLDRLEQLELRNQVSSSARIQRKVVDAARNLTLVEQSTHAGADWQPIGSWIVTHHNLLDPPAQARKDYIDQRGLEARIKAGDEIDFSDARVSLALCVDAQDEFCAADGPLYAFFPVRGQRSGLRFAVQADFLTTASRESLAPPSPGDWNDWIVSNIPAAIIAGVETIKRRPNAASILYSALPLEQDGTPSEDDTLASFRKVTSETVARLRELPIIATDRPGDLAWVVPSEAALLETALHDLIEDDDLPVITPDRRAFVSRSVRGERALDFLTNPLGLHLPVIGTAVLIGALRNGAWVQGKPESWHRKLLIYLASANLETAQREALKAIAFLPVEGRWAKPTEGVFLPTDEPTYRLPGAIFLRPILEADDATVRAFLAELDVRAPSSDELIRRVIMPVLKRHKGGAALKDAVLATYANFVCTYASKQHEPAKELGTRLRDLLYLRADDGNWKLANTLSAPVNADGEPSLAGYLLAGASGGFLVRKPAKNRAMSVKLWNWLGVPTSPPVEQLIAALGEPAWYAAKPAIWDCTLYTYLDQCAITDTQLKELRRLPVVRLAAATPATFDRTQGAIFFALTDDTAADAGMREMLNSAGLAFVEPAAYTPANEDHGYPADSKRAKALLTKLNVNDLNPQEVIQQIITPAFRPIGNTCTPALDAQRLRYTLFVLHEFKRDERFRESRAWQEFKSAVKLKTTQGLWHRPQDLFLTKAYGWQDFEVMLAELPQVSYVSREYLALTKDSSWRIFFIWLGVTFRLPVRVESQPQVFSDLIQRDSNLKKYLYRIRESGGVLNDDDRHRITGHAVMPHLEAILKSQNTDRIEALLVMLTDSWASNYRQQMQQVSYSYLYSGSWCDGGKKPSHIAWLLRQNLPTQNGLRNGTRPETRVYRQDEKIQALVGDMVDYLSYRPQETAKELLSGHLGLIWSADEVHLDDVLQHLRQLKATDTATVERCATLYTFLATKPQARGWLERDALIFLPTAKSERRWWSPSELFWKNHHDLFGSMRGYVDVTSAYRPHYTVFETLGVNVGDPGPKDWADLLKTIAQAKAKHPPRDRIACAYRELEQFFQTLGEGNAPNWWDDFANTVSLLMESGGFAGKPFYVADHPIRHAAFKKQLPFIWLPDSHGLFRHLVEKLSSRRISDDKWVSEEVHIGRHMRDTRSQVIHDRLIACRPFIRSILMHKVPQHEPEFRLTLDRLSPGGALVVEVVHRLSVEMRTKEDPVIKHVLAGAQQAYYAPQSGTLSILATAVEDWEAIGLGVSTMFGAVADAVRSELMQLLDKAGNQPAMIRLLERLRIPLVDPLPLSTAIPTKKVDPGLDAQVPAPAESVTTPQTDAEDDPDDSIDDAGEGSPGDAAATGERPQTGGYTATGAAGHTGAYQNTHVSQLGSTATQTPARSGAGTGQTPKRDSATGQTPKRDGAVGQQIVAVTYVSGDASDADDDDATDGSSQARQARGRMAEQRVYAYEQRQGRVPEQMEQNHPGYDIRSCDRDGRILRYIEVKSIGGVWGARGVGLSDRQFAEAQHQKAAYWLYVVEWPEDAARCRITCIQNPAARASRFYFDDGWRTLADEESAGQGA